MRERLTSIAQWMLGRPTHWLAPLTAALFLLMWIIGEAGRGPWPGLLGFLIPAALILGLAPWLPIVSVVGMIALPLAQVVGLVVRPESTTWPIYLAIPLAGLVLGAAATGRVRRWVPVTGAASMLTAAFLMAAPSASGSRAEWTGYMFYGMEPPPWRVNPHEQDLVLLGLAGIGLFLLAWGVGVLYRMGVTGRLRGLAALLADPATDAPSLPPHTTIAGLTPRELEIFALVARGLSNAEIAANEHISEATVKTHVSSILRKLDLRSRTQLAAHARELEAPQAVTLDA
jgi:DNA-binding CsgD family transcriptional regulator